MYNTFIMDRIGQAKQAQVIGALAEGNSIRATVRMTECRQTMRMQMRRFTHPTDAFSKKIDNLGCAVALHFMHYNFCRVQQTLRGPIRDHIWSIEEIFGLPDLSKSQQEAALWCPNNEHYL